MNKLLDLLTEGDLRSEGKAEQVAGDILSNPSLIEMIMPGLSSSNKVVRGRVCMTMEIISRTAPELIFQNLSQLVDLASKDTVPQVRWHLAEIFGNVRLPEYLIDPVTDIMLDYLDDKSKIVKFCSVQTLGVLGKRTIRKPEIINRIKSQKDKSKSLGKIVSKVLTDLGENV